MLNIDLDNHTAEDGRSFFRALTGEARPGSFHEAIVHNHSNGTFAIRESRWKLVLSNGSGGREKPSGKPFAEPYQLFDLEADPGEQNDLAAEQADLVERLSQTVEQYRTQRRSVPRR